MAAVVQIGAARQLTVVLDASGHQAAITADCYIQLQ
jgi:hypothetical protein